MKEPNKNCEVCQKPFYSRASHAKYCEKCRKEANARKRKEYYQGVKESRSQKIKEKRQSLKENDPVAYAEMLAQETARRRKRATEKHEQILDYQCQYNAKKRAEMGDKAYREYHRTFEQSVNKKGSKAWREWAKEHDIEAYEAYRERCREYNKKYYNARKSKNNSNQ